MKFGQRRSFNKIKRKYKRIKKANVRLTQSTLLLIQPILATRTVYKFLVLESDTPVLPAEVRLNINDEFISYEVAYYVLGELLDAGTGVGTLHHSYAPVELDGSFAQLTGAWRATMQILVNKISRLENWDMKKHNVVTRTQWATLADPVAPAYPPTQASVDFEDSGAVPMQPMLTLSGAKKNDVIVSLDGAIAPTSLGAWTVADGDVFDISATELAVYFRGMLAQNAAKFQ